MFVKILWTHTHTHRQTQYDYHTPPPMLRGEGNKGPYCVFNIDFWKLNKISHFSLKAFFSFIHVTL